MYTNVNEFQFMEAFKDMNRMDNFSPEGLRALFAFFEQLEDDTGEPMELDVIAICCDFNQEYYNDIMENYGLVMDDLDLDNEEDDEEVIAEAVLQWLSGETCVVSGVLEDNTILYQVF